MDQFLADLSRLVLPNWEKLTVLGFFLLVIVILLVRMPTDRSMWAKRIRKTFFWFLAGIPNGFIFGVSIYHLMPNNTANERVSAFFIFLFGIPALISVGYILGLLGQRKYLDRVFGHQSAKKIADDD